MEGLTATLAAAVAKAVVVKAGTDLSQAGIKDLKKRILGAPQEKALAAALERAYARMLETHADVLREFDVNPAFLEYEGADELAKALVPNKQADPAALATVAVDTTFSGLDDDTRWEYIGRLRPAFRCLLQALPEEVGREVALADVAGRVADAQVADATTRLARHVGAAAATESDEAAYLHWVIDTQRYLRTVGMVSNTTLQIPLEDVFVSLKGVRDMQPGDRAEEWFAREQNELERRRELGDLDQTAFEAALDRLDLQRAHERGRTGLEPETAPPEVTQMIASTVHLLVLGDPGSGKTTLLRYLALQHARALARPGDEADGALGSTKLPVFVRIGDFARSPKRDEGLGRFLGDYLEFQECPALGIRDLLDRKLDEGGCLILLDGLDEVASAAERRDVVTAVTNFVTAYGRQGNRFVVTSRIAGYLGAPLPSAFDAVRVQDMDDATIERFLAAYCPALERAEAPKKSVETVRRDADAAIAALLDAFRNNAGVRRLAANPLLLTALLLVHRARGRLPHRRVDAYVEVTEALGRTWRSVHGVPEADLPDERVLTTWLTRLGAWMHEFRPEGSASKRELVEVLAPLWAEHIGVEWDPRVLLAADPLACDAARGVLDFVTKTEVHTGLLVERAAGRYGFPHLTFEEYYAGRALAFEGLAADRPARIRARLHDPRYDEPILLALGLVGRVQPEEVERLMTEAILGNVDAPTPEEALLGRDFRFALRILADDIPVSAVFVDRLLRQACDEWFSPDSRCRFSAYRAALRERLVGLGATRAAVRLGAVVHEREAEWGVAPDSFVSMATVLAKMGNLTTYGIANLIRIATFAKNARLRGDAVEALGSAAESDPEVAAALVAVVMGPDTPLVRARAATALGPAAASNPDVLASMVGLIAGDQSPVVHALASRALGNTTTSRSDVVEALIGIASRGSGTYVRARAVRSLGPAASSNDEVAAALIGIMTGNDAPEVRIQAARALGPAAGSNDMVAAALIAIVTGNDAPEVRLQAARALGPAAGSNDMVAAALIAIVTGNDAPEVRVRAATALDPAAISSNPEVVAAMIGIATGSDEPYTRAEAAAALGEAVSSNPMVTATMIGIAAGAGDPYKRVRAATALGPAVASSPEVVAAMIGIATGNFEPYARAQAATALGLAVASNPAVVAAMIGIAAGADEPYVRVQAAEGLAAAGALTAVVINAVVPLLDDHEAETRRSVATLLGRSVPGTDIEGPLIGLFKDEDGDVRQSACDALVSLAREHPSATRRIIAGLVRASCDPSFDGLDDWNRSGWDYAYSALWALTGGAAQH